MGESELSSTDRVSDVDIYGSEAARIFQVFRGTGTWRLPEIGERLAQRSARCTISSWLRNSALPYYLKLKACNGSEKRNHTHRLIYARSGTDHIKVPELLLGYREHPL